MKTRWLAALALAATLVVAACEQAPGNRGEVLIYNLGHTTATVEWQTPGILGTALFGGSTTEPVPPCGLAQRLFWSGDYPITITTATDRLAFEFHAAPPVATAPMVVAAYAIDAGGHVAQANPAAMPANGTCIP